MPYRRRPLLLIPQISSHRLAPLGNYVVYFHLPTHTGRRADHLTLRPLVSGHKLLAASLCPHKSVKLSSAVGQRWVSSQSACFLGPHALSRPHQHGRSSRGMPRDSATPSIGSLARFSIPRPASAPDGQARHLGGPMSKPQCYAPRSGRLDAPLSDRRNRGGAPPSRVPSSVLWNCVVFTDPYPVRTIAAAVDFQSLGTYLSIEVCGQLTSATHSVPNCVSTSHNLDGQSAGGRAEAICSPVTNRGRSAGRELGKATGEMVLYLGWVSTCTSAPTLKPPPDRSGPETNLPTVAGCVRALGAPATRLWALSPSLTSDSSLRLLPCLLLL